MATAALIYFTHPLFTILLLHFIFKEALSGQKLLVMGLIIIACALILSPGSLTVGQFGALLMSFLMPISFATLLKC